MDGLNDHFVILLGKLYLKRKDSGSQEGEKVAVDSLEFPVRAAVVEFNKKGIWTNNSEGGGDRRHGAPNFAYIEAELNHTNLRIVREKGYELDKVFDRNGDLLFGGSAVRYGEGGYRVIGFNRSRMNTREVVEKMKQLVDCLEDQ